MHIKENVRYYVSIACSALALCVVMPGCALVHHGAAQTALVQAGGRGPWMLLYADKERLYACRHGRSRFVVKNPAGYDSLDDWIGYAGGESSIVFYRFREHHFRVIKVQARKKKAYSRDTHIASRDDFPANYCVYADKLWVIRGAGHKAVLWHSGLDGRWDPAATWSVPSNVPLPKTWSSAPAIDGTSVAFMTPSDYVLLCDTASGTAARIVSQGDTKYADPGFEDSGSTGAGVAISSAEGWVFFDATLPQDIQDLRFFAVNYQTGDRRTYQVKHKRGFSLMAPPERILRLRLVPGRDYIACEVLESGMSSIALIDRKSGQSSYLPFAIERYQWCVVPGG